MYASIALHRRDAGASTTQSPAQRPGGVDDGGFHRHLLSSMHALFGREVQYFFGPRKPGRLQGQFGVL